MEHEKDLARVDGERLAPAAGSTAKSATSGVPSLASRVNFKLVDGFETLAIAHARKQGAADGFQTGWHAALTRVEHGDNAYDLRSLVPSPARPPIICLCGSTRFIEQFAVQTWELELQGFIVLGCTLLPSWYCPVRDHFAESLGVKEQRDNHHLQKIDLSDEVLVLNVGGYIGESTRNEIAYAIEHGKVVRYLEPASERTTGADYAVDPADGTQHFTPTRDSESFPFAAPVGAQAQTK